MTDEIARGQRVVAIKRIPANQPVAIGRVGTVTATFSGGAFTVRFDGDDRSVVCSRLDTTPIAATEAIIIRDAEALRQLFIADLARRIDAIPAHAEALLPLLRAWADMTLEIDDGEHARAWSRLDRSAAAARERSDIKLQPEPPPAAATGEAVP